MAVNFLYLEKSRRAVKMGKIKATLNKAIFFPSFKYSGEEIFFLFFPSQYQEIWWQKNKITIQKLGIAVFTRHDHWEKAYLKRKCFSFDFWQNQKISKPSVQYSNPE